MSEQKKERNAKASGKTAAKTSIFYENPYDIETFFEGLEVAGRAGKELQYVDRFISHLRMDPLQDASDVVFKVLNRDLNILPFEPNK